MRGREEKDGKREGIREEKEGKGGKKDCEEREGEKRGKYMGGGREEK